MNLEKFAKDCGVILLTDLSIKDWHGHFGYSTKDNPNSRCCGYKTARSAYKAWLIDTFGDHAAKGILKLLKSYDALEKARCER